MESAKEITLSYLESIKKDYENAFLEWVSSDYSNRSKLLSITLAEEISILNKAIKIVEESE